MAAPRVPGDGRDEALTVVYVWAVRRLWSALNAHLDEHGCGTCDPKDPRYVGGFAHCPTGDLLWRLLPERERILHG